MNDWSKHIYAVVKIALLGVIAAAAVSGLGLYAAVSEASLLQQQAQLEATTDIRDLFKGKTQTSEDKFVTPEHIT